MKTKLHLLVTASVFTLATCETSLAAKEFREELHQTFPLTENGKLSVANVNGSVRIMAWDRNEVQLDAVKHAKKQEHLDEVKIEIESKPERIRIQTKQPTTKRSWFGFARGNNNSTSVDYTITVPRHVHLDKVSNVNGDVEIQASRGDVMAETVNGRLTATGLTGRTKLSSVNGPVRAAFSELNEAKEVSLSTVNGSLSVSLPDHSNADVSGSTVNGGISSDFTLPIKKHFPISQSLKGKLGQGGTQIKLSTVNGGIQIQRSQSVALEK